jgi:PIN domain nuclease of toxin-antitoxin system
MKYLLDTVVWLWSVGDTERLNKTGLAILKNGEEELYFSAASAWEIAIKTQLGKYELPDQPGRYLPKRLAEQGIHSLPVAQRHALRICDLPLYHRDPFDRLLIAQAIEEQMLILTADRVFEKYAVEIAWCGR